MDRRLHLVQKRYAIHLTPDEYKDVLYREVERRINGLDTLGELLYDTYPVSDVKIVGQSIYFSMCSQQDDSEEHHLILNDIEQYVEGIENFWTGLDNGEDF